MYFTRSLKSFSSSFFVSFSPFSTNSIIGHYLWLFDRLARSVHTFSKWFFRSLWAVSWNKRQKPSNVLSKSILTVDYGALRQEDYWNSLSIWSRISGNEIFAERQRKHSYNYFPCRIMWVPTYYPFACFLKESLYYEKNTHTWLDTLVVLKDTLRPRKNLPITYLRTIVFLKFLFHLFDQLPSRQFYSKTSFTCIWCILIAAWIIRVQSPTLVVPNSKPCYIFSLYIVDVGCILKVLKWILGNWNES